LVTASPAAAVDSIADGLRLGVIGLDSSSGELELIDGVSRETAMRAARVFLDLRDCEDPAGVALALSTANSLRIVTNLDSPQIEIVWTGPDAEGPLVRPTHAVIREMIAGVQEAGEILIVGYSLTVGKDTAMEQIVHLLEKAVSKRARIKLILHKDELAANKDKLLKAWSVLVKKPVIMTWDPPADHPYTKLHAKTLVVDRLDLLVGSANFTFHGLSSNLELGLRIRGPQAREVAERFDFLEARGTIVEWA